MKEIRLIEDSKTVKPNSDSQTKITESLADAINIDKSEPHPMDSYERLDDPENQNTF